MRTRLGAESLENRNTPSLAYTHDGQVSDGTSYIHPIPDFTGPINLAVVEPHDPVPDGSLKYDYYAIPGPGGGPRLVVGSFTDGVNRVDQFVFDDSFRGGVNIDASRDYVVLGAMEGGGPRVQVLDARTLAVVADFFAYSADFRGGVNVSLMTVNGTPEIVTGPGVGGGPNVRAFDIHGNPLSSFFVDTDAPRGGVKVTNALGSIDTLAGHVLTSYGLDGIRNGSETMVLDDVESMGRDYYTANLVPHVTLGTTNGRALEYDLNPLFAVGRLISNDPVANAPIIIGNVTQLDGVARFNLTGGLAGLDDAVYSPEARLNPAQFPLGAAVSPAPGAYAVGALDGGTGSLTGYVADAAGNVYGLTNHHVVQALDGSAPIGKVIYQPGPAFPAPAPFGTVAMHTEAVDHSITDSALIHVSSFNNLTAYTDFNGNVGYVQAHGTGTVGLGGLVYKFGFWGVRMGLVVAVNQTVTVQEEDGSLIHFDGQTVVASAEDGIEWIIPGDSGSLVTDYHGVRVGQVFAGNSIVGVFSPIQNALDATGTHFVN